VQLAIALGQEIRVDYVFLTLLIALGVLVLDPVVYPAAAKAILILLSVVCLLSEVVAWTSAVTARR
jgi:hypothetical protein